MSVRMIQALYVIWMIMTIGIYQAPLPIKGLLEYNLEEEALKAYWILNISQLSLI